MKIQTLLLGIAVATSQVGYTMDRAAISYKIAKCDGYTVHKVFVMALCPEDVQAIKNSCTEPGKKKTDVEIILGDLLGQKKKLSMVTLNTAEKRATVRDFVERTNEALSNRHAAFFKGLEATKAAIIENPRSNVMDDLMSELVFYQKDVMRILNASAQ